MGDTQRTTYSASPSYAHVNLTVKEDVQWHLNAGYLLMSGPVDRYETATKDNPYVLWSPKHYGTSVIYEEDDVHP